MASRCLGPRSMSHSVKDPRTRWRDMQQNRVLFPVCTAGIARVICNERPTERYISCERRASIRESAGVPLHALVSVFFS